MKFHEFISTNMEAILSEWEAFASTLPPAENMGVAQLRDHARQILETIATDMVNHQSVIEQMKNSTGKGRLKALSLEFAKQHAAIRHEEGFDINQVVSEYRALRASVVRLWSHNRQINDDEIVVELTRFNEEIDQALTYAIQEYSAVADGTRQHIINELQESEKHCRAMADSLQKSDKYKDDFLAILAHELRSPLAPIQTGIEVLRLTQGIPAAAAHSLNMMERQMAHIVRLVEDLLDISRISRGKINLRLEEVDLADVIHVAVEATISCLYAGKRKVSIELPSEPLIVQGDAVRIAQIVGNLLSNAGKYTSENGHIWISVRREGQQAKIVVRDDGAGIAPEQMDKLFEMFRQYDITRGEGLGIGLSLARKLVELHGGSITGRSEGLGRGSEFVICLSLPNGGRQTSATEKGTDSIRHDAWKVLVVDDNPDAAASLDMLLQLLGSKSRMAHDGPSALTLLEEFHPDLVLLDIGLPGMDGYEVARRMREKAEGKDIKIVVVSGWGQDEDRKRSLRSGVDEHLVKPIGLGDIRRLMESLKPA